MLKDERKEERKRKKKKEAEGREKEFDTVIRESLMSSDNRATV